MRTFANNSEGNCTEANSRLDAHSATRREECLHEGSPAGGIGPGDDLEDLGRDLLLPGIESKDIDIRFENGVLTLRGERKLEHEDKRDKYHRVELSYGTFTRSFSLPGTIDAEKIKAESKNGVLTVLLPKKPEAKPKSIQVKVG